MKGTPLTDTKKAHDEYFEVEVSELRQRQNMLLPFITGIGVGAAVSGMMKGRNANMQNMAQMIPGLSQMTGGTTGTNNNQNQ